MGAGSVFNRFFMNSLRETSSFAKIYSFPSIFLAFCLVAPSKAIGVRAIYGVFAAWAIGVHAISGVSAPWAIGVRAIYGVSAAAAAVAAAEHEQLKTRFACSRFHSFRLGAPKFLPLECSRIPSAWLLPNSFLLAAPEFLPSAAAAAEAAGSSSRQQQQ